MKTVLLKFSLSIWKNNILLINSLFLLTAVSYSQSVGINPNGSSPSTSAILDVNSPNQGVLLPRISLTSLSDNTTIVGPQHDTTSLLVYNTNASIGEGAGFYWWDGTVWRSIVAPTSPGTDGQVLTSTGTGTAPEWETLSSSGEGGCGPIEATNELDFMNGQPCTLCPGSQMTIRDCSISCDNLVYGGHDDWRVPTIDEAVQAINLFPNNTSTDWIWSSTVISSSAGYYFTLQLKWLNWGTNIYNGNQYCRCVR